jgi:hypothetical protein
MKRKPKVVKLVGARVSEAQWKKFKKQCEREGVTMQKKISSLVTNSK